MLFKLFLLFSLVPAAEIALLIYCGSLIGMPYTIAIVMTTAIAGAIMVRREGFSVIQRFRASLMQGVFPSEEIMDGALVLVSGALLLTPGFITDTLGFCLVFPPTRALIKPPLRSYLMRRYVSSFH